MKPKPEPKPENTTAAASSAMPDALPGPLLGPMPGPMPGPRPGPSPEPVPEPLVGGEPARLLAEAIRGFPISLGPSGAPRLHNIATGATRAMIQRAYERVEFEVMDDMAHCGRPGEHRTMDVHEYEWLIYTDLMWKVKVALGQTSRVEALWTGC